MELEKLKELLYSGEKEKIKTSLEQGKDSTEFQELIKHINEFIDWKHSAEHFQEEDKYERPSFLDVMTTKTFDFSKVIITNEPIPNQIKYLEQLETLNLKQCWFLEDFELEWGDDRILDISDEASLLEFPEGMENLKNLMTVDLSGNYLKNIPDFIFKLPKLEELNLSANFFYYLPKEIGNLEYLSILNLANSSIDEIPEEIGKLSSLRRLNVENTHISEAKSGAKLRALLPDTIISYCPHNDDF